MAAATDRSGGGARPRHQPPGETEPGGGSKMPLTKGKSYSTLLQFWEQKLSRSLI